MSPWAGPRTAALFLGRVPDDEDEDPKDPAPEETTMPRAKPIDEDDEQEADQEDEEDTEEEEGELEEDAITDPSEPPPPTRPAATKPSAARCAWTEGGRRCTSRPAQVRSNSDPALADLCRDHRKITKDRDRARPSKKKTSPKLPARPTRKPDPTHLVQAPPAPGTNDLDELRDVAPCLRKDLGELLLAVLEENAHARQVGAWLATAPRKGA